MQNKTTNIRKLTGTAMLGAVAAVLMYMEFPIPIMPSFVKLDVSELPALLAAYAYGVVSSGWAWAAPRRCGRRFSTAFHFCWIVAGQSVGQLPLCQGKSAFRESAPVKLSRLVM